MLYDTKEFPVLLQVTNLFLCKSCHIGCYWPAQVPDQLNHAPDWTNKCAAAQKDWRKIDLIFP